MDLFPLYERSLSSPVYQLIFIHSKTPHLKNNYTHAVLGSTVGSGTDTAEYRGCLRSPFVSAEVPQMRSSGMPRLNSSFHECHQGPHLSAQAVAMRWFHSWIHYFPVRESVPITEIAGEGENKSIHTSGRFLFEEPVESYYPFYTSDENLSDYAVRQEKLGVWWNCCWSKHTPPDW